MFEKSATAKQLAETHEAIASTARTFAHLLGVLSASIARKAGIDPEELVEDFLRNLGQGESAIDPLLAQAIALELQRAAARSELAERRSAREDAGQ